MRSTCTSQANHNILGRADVPLSSHARSAPFLTSLIFRLRSTLPLTSSWSSTELTLSLPHGFFWFLPVPHTAFPPPQALSSHPRTFVVPVRLSLSFAPIIDALHLLTTFPTLLVLCACSSAVFSCRSKYSFLMPTHSDVDRTGSWHTLPIP